MHLTHSTKHKVVSLLLLWLFRKDKESEKLDFTPLKSAFLYWHLFQY